MKQESEPAAVPGQGVLQSESSRCKGPEVGPADHV